MREDRGSDKRASGARGQSVLLTDADLEGYFETQLTSALSQQRFEAKPQTTRYIVGLLTRFVRSRELFQHEPDYYGIKPLAMQYADAVRSSTAIERDQALRRLGDIALFVAGLFSQSLRRKQVGIDYYIAMGGNAYDFLAQSGASREIRAKGEVFAELSVHFAEFVDALAEIGESSTLSSDRDLLHTYEIWLQTGSSRAARSLRRHGIVPLACARNPIHH